MDKAAEREFREYVAARQGALFRTALLLTGHREDAEDLLQTALAKLAVKWTRLHKSGSPDAYVRKILYHQQISRWRRLRNRREHPTPELPEPSGVSDLATDSATRLALAGALRRLTDRQRAVIVLRYYEDLPEAEVAAILGCTVGTVRSQAHRTSPAACGNMPTGIGCQSGRATTDGRAQGDQGVQGAVTDGMHSHVLPLPRRSPWILIVLADLAHPAEMVAGSCRGGKRPPAGEDRGAGNPRCARGR